MTNRDIKYYKNGNLYQDRQWFNGKVKTLDGNLGRLNHTIIYFENGNKLHEFWRLENDLHREDGPASLEYHSTGMLCREKWYVYGKLHRMDGPAITEWLNGKLYTESWYENDDAHRLDGPQYVQYHANGCKHIEIWKQNDMHHRENGPALSWYTSEGEMESEEWLLRGKTHRTDGPAYINLRFGGDRSEEWFIDDQNITDLVNSLNLKAPLSKEDQMLLKMYL